MSENLSDLSKKQFFKGISHEMIIDQLKETIDLDQVKSVQLTENSCIVSVTEFFETQISTTPLTKGHHSLALIIFLVSEEKAFEQLPIRSNVNLCPAVFRSSWIFNMAARANNML
jgi:hypothetical protein